MSNRNYWFKAKRYGWGWYPASWQGWTVIFLYIVVLLFLFLTLDSQLHSPVETIRQFFPLELLLTIVLVAVCYTKGEKPSWNWGGKKKSSRK